MYFYMAGSNVPSLLDSNGIDGSLARSQFFHGRDIIYCLTFVCPSDFSLSIPPRLGFPLTLFWRTLSLAFLLLSFVDAHGTSSTPFDNPFVSPTRVDLHYSRRIFIQKYRPLLHARAVMPFTT